VRTSRGVLVPDTTRASGQGSGALETQHSSRWLDPSYETWRCYSLAPASMDHSRCINAFAVPRAATCKLLRASRCPTRRALLGWTSLSRKVDPCLTFPVTHEHRSAAPVREVSSLPEPLPVVQLSPVSQDRLLHAR